MKKIVYFASDFYDRHVIKLIIDKGSAINEAINIVTIDISNPSVNPIKNINFISPPPRLSFLNIK